MKILLSAAAIYLSLFGFINTTIAQTWTQTQAPSTNWNSVAISADGTTIVAGAGTSSHAGPIFVSTDMGVTWVQTNIPHVLGWQSVASSADGNILVATSYTPRSYTSTNSGLTWTWLTNAPNTSFIAVSPDGVKLFAVHLQDFYSSTNFGVTWMTNVVSGATLFICAASSDGSKIEAGGLSGAVYTSTNYGTNWKAGPSSGGWPSVTSSVDGSKFAAAPIGPSFQVLTSTDSGDNWTTNQTLDNSPVHYLASSADGSTLIVAGQGGKIFTSLNGGINWVTNNAPSTNWVSVAASADGKILVGAANGGGIWISQIVPTPFLKIANSNSNLILSWLVPSATFELQQSSDFSFDNWVTMTNTPTINFINLDNEIVISPSSRSAFYRLATP